MKILAVASIGGHWIQLIRLMPLFVEHDVTFVTTNPAFAETVKGYKFYCIPDSNRRKKIDIIKSSFYITRCVLKVRPKVIITTGAAPGLMCIIAGKLIGAKTIWIDSIANVEKLSMSGKIASKIADIVYTQWEHLATSKITYCGNVL
jgi:UDP-N-acetylglucosamine:LPS N-acetylglucosamine transferase